MYTILRSKSHGLEKPLLGFAAELIKHPSTSLEEEQVALLVEAQMRAAGFDKVFRDENRQCNWNHLRDGRRPNGTPEQPHGYGCCR